MPGEPHTEQPGGVLVECDEVQFPATDHGQDDADGEHDGHRDHIGHVPPVCRTGQPGEGLRRVERVAEHDDQADQRRRCGGDPDAQQDQPVLLEAAPRGQPEHERGGDRGTAEGGARDLPRAGGLHGGHQEDGAESGASGDAQDTWLRERVAGDCLHQGAGQRERTAA